MTYMGPATQSYDFTHMWDMTDLRAPAGPKSYCPNSLMYIIATEPDFSKFNYLVNLADMEGVFTDPQADFTIFVPSDKSLVGMGQGPFINMDRATARNIIKSSMLNRKITSDILEDSPAAYFITRDPPNRLFVTNLSGVTQINNNVTIIHKNIDAVNGMIHVIDGLIWPNMSPSPQY